MALAKPTNFSRIGTSMPRRYKWNAGAGDVVPDFYEVGIPAIGGVRPETLFGTKPTPGTDADPFVIPDDVVVPYGTFTVAVRAVKQTGTNATTGAPVYTKTGWSNQISQTFAMGVPTDFTEIL